MGHRGQHHHPPKPASPSPSTYLRHRQTQLAMVPAGGEPLGLLSSPSGVRLNVASRGAWCWGDGSCQRSAVSAAGGTGMWLLVVRWAVLLDGGLAVLRVWGGQHGNEDVKLGT